MALKQGDRLTSSNHRQWRAFRQSQESGDACGADPNRRRHSRRIKDGHILPAFEQYDRSFAFRKMKQAQVSCNETRCTGAELRTDVEHASISFVNHWDTERTKERDGLFNVRFACGVMGIFADDHYAVLNAQRPPQAKKVTDRAKEKRAVLAINEQQGRTNGDPIGCLKEECCVDDEAIRAVWRFHNFRI